MEKDIFSTQYLLLQWLEAELGLPVIFSPSSYGEVLPSLLMEVL